MPGFNIGGGNDPSQKNSLAEPRRVHRWAITGITCGGQQVLTAGDCAYLEKAARPQFSYELATMHHNQEEAYFAGKQKWEPIELAWYDTEQPVDVSRKLAQWAQRITKSFFEAGAVTRVAVPSDYKSTVNIGLLDGDGVATQTWTIHNAWPEKTNWGELDYTSSEILRISVTMRYDKAELVLGTA